MKIALPCCSVSGIGSKLPCESSAFESSILNDGSPIAGGLRLYNLPSALKNDVSFHHQPHISRQKIYKQPQRLIGKKQSKIK